MDIWGEDISRREAIECLKDIHKAIVSHDGSFIPVFADESHRIAVEKSIMILEQEEI